jgi:RNA polymerase sigma-70 factor (ECF subfamily)
MSAASSFKSRSEAELRAVVDAHFDFIWRLLRRMGLPPADADDETQHVFMTAMEKFDRVAPGSERTFLYGVALRVLANARRKRHRRREDALESAPAPRDSGQLPDGALESARTRDELDSLLAELPDELRRVLVLTALDELSMAEVAVLEGIPSGTVASRLRRARALFREKLARTQSGHDKEAE